MWGASQRRLPEGSFKRPGGRAPWHKPSLLTLGSTQGKKSPLTHAVYGGPRVQRMGTGFLTVVPGQSSCLVWELVGNADSQAPLQFSLKQNLIFNQPMTPRHSQVWEALVQNVSARHIPAGDLSGAQGHGENQW